MPPEERQEPGSPPPEPVVPAWVFVGTFIVGWGLAIFIVGFMVIRNSFSLPAALFAAWCLSLPFTAKGNPFALLRDALTGGGRR